MSARVSLSRRDAQVLAAYAERHLPVLGYTGAHELGPVVERLRAALSPRPKEPMRVERERKQHKVAAEKRQETRDLWAQAAERAGGNCEACLSPFNPGDPPELDHALGRGKARQSITNVWLIHRSCHRARHAARPSRYEWLLRWRLHALLHGYGAEAFDAEAKMESAALSRASAEAGKGVR